MIAGCLIHILECFLFCLFLCGQVRLNWAKEGALLVCARHPLQFHDLFGSTRYLFVLCLEFGSIVAVSVVLIEEALLVELRELARLRDSFLQRLIEHVDFIQLFRGPLSLPDFRFDAIIIHAL